MSTTPTTPRSNSEADGPPTCRICFDGADAQLGRLFRPCKCNGSQQFIHESCLAACRAQSLNRDHYFRCPTCKYEYQFTRATVAQILSNKGVSATISAILIVSAVLFVAYFLKWFGVLFLGLKSARGVFSLTGKLVWWATMAIGVITLIVLMFSSNDGDNGNLAALPRLLDGTMINANYIGLEGLFVYVGNITGIFGFGAFCFLVWKRVQQITTTALENLGERILEVQ